MKNTPAAATANILIHGFNGEPADMEYLHAYLTERGLVSYVLKLNGHAGTRAEMMRNGCNSWIRGVMRDVAEIKSRHAKINLVGFSMGGLLTVNVLEKFAADKVVFVNTAVYFWNMRQIVDNIRNDINNKKYNNIKHYLCASHSAPLPSLFNFLRIVFLSRPKFKNVTAKALILQNKDDDTVQPRSALYIKDKLKHNAKLVWFETGGHMMFVDERKEDAARAVYEFLTG